MIVSLQDLCIVPAAVALSTHPEVKKAIFNKDMENCPFSKCESLLEEWNKSVQQKLKKIMEDIPYRLREKIPMNLITLIGIKMVEWARYHKKEFEFNFCFSKKFITRDLFTSKGTIDKEKAVGLLLNDKKLNLFLRFKIACSYFLTDIVSSLHNQLSFKIKTKYLNKPRENFTPQDEMVEFFDHLRDGKVKKLLKKGVRETHDSTYSYAYSIAVRSRNEIAAINCWKKLGSEAKKLNVRILLDKIALRLVVGPSVNSECFFEYCEPYFDMLRLLFIHSDVDIKKRLVSDDISFFVLKCFLNWPNQGLFLEAVELVVETLPKIKYYSLMHEIIERFQNVYSETYNYRYLLRELWNLGPNNNKRYVLGVKEAGEHPPEPEEGVYDTHKTSHNYGFLIKKLFELKKFTSDDEENIRFILGSATPEEKTKIVAKQGKGICYSAITSGNYTLADLFVECCLEEGPADDFKKSLISSFYGGIIFEKVLFEENYDLGNEVLKWAIKSDEMDKFKENLLSFVGIKSIKQYYLKERGLGINCINNFIKWAAPNRNIEEYKREYLKQSDFTNAFRYSIFSGEPMEIQRFLRWFFSNRRTIFIFKKELAFKLVRVVNEYFDINKGLRFVDTFVEWCQFTKEERNAFVRRFAYKSLVLKRCSEYAVNHELTKIDEFITWLKLPKEDIREFKRHLVVTYSKIHTTYSDLIIKGKENVVNNFIEWSELTGDNVKSFKKLLALSQDELLYKYKNLIMKGEFKGIEEILNRFLLSEEEFKEFRKKIVVQNLSAIEYLILESKWDKIEEVLKWCFTLAKDVNRFKRENFLNRRSNGLNIYFLLTIAGKYEDTKMYLNWLKIHNENKKKEFIKQVMFNVKVFQSICRLLVEEKEQLVTDNLKCFLHDVETVNRFRQTFLLWYAEQMVRNYCVNCGGMNVDTEHTYNLMRTPVFCYNVMRRTATPQHLDRFKVVLDSFMSTLVLQHQCDVVLASVSDVKTVSLTIKKTKLVESGPSNSNAKTGTEKRTKQEENETTDSDAMSGTGKRKNQESGPSNSNVKSGTEKRTKQEESETPDSDTKSGTGKRKKQGSGPSNSDAKARIGKRAKQEKSGTPDSDAKSGTGKRKKQGSGPSNSDAKARIGKRAKQEESGTPDSVAKFGTEKRKKQGSCPPNSDAKTDKGKGTKQGSCPSNSDAKTVIGKRTKQGSGPSKKKKV